MNEIIDVERKIEDVCEWWDNLSERDRLKIMMSAYSKADKGRNILNDIAQKCLDNNITIEDLRKEGVE
jgi:hypothetical protein